MNVLAWLFRCMFCVAFNTEITGVIASLALLVSIGLLVVQYRNQVERRHAEITKLLEKILGDLNNERQRLNAFLTNCEFTRLELRRLPDSSKKYEFIERWPPIIKAVLVNKKSLDEIIESLEKVNSQTVNRTDILLNLQSASAICSKIRVNHDKAEADLLSFLKIVQQNMG